MRRRPPTSTLFPYTTLFRSRPERGDREVISLEPNPTPSQAVVQAFPGRLATERALERDDRALEVTDEVLGPGEQGSRLVVVRIQDDGFAQKVSRLAELARLEKGPALVEGRLCPHAPARILEEARRCRRERGRRRDRRGAIGSLLRRLPRALGRVPRAERREAREAIGVGLGRGRETRCLCGGLLGLAGRVGRGAGRVHRGIRNFAGVLDLRSGPDLGRVPLADSLGRLRRLRGETGGFGGGPHRE